LNTADKNIGDEAWFTSPGLGRVFELLNTDGGEVRVVGGAIRNTLMGEAVGDVDLATTVLPEDLITRAKAARIKAIPTGIDHGTVTLVIDGQGFEVTTLRTDIKPMGRHAEVAFGEDWQADAERRDFTVNALYADHTGLVHDPVGGMADIESRTIRFIGEAEKRIEEDHLRILRFFRFFARYGGGRPDADGLRACVRQREKLNSLSAERVWKELKSLLAAPDPGRSLLWMRQSGILTLLLPETEKWGIDAVAGLIASENAHGWSPDPLLRLMAMVPPDTIRMEALAARLKMSKAEAARLKEWALATAPQADTAGTVLERLIYRHGKTPVCDRLKLAQAAIRARPANEIDDKTLADMASFSKLLARAEKFKRPQFPLNGKDLIKAGLEPGETIGQRLAAAETKWIESNFTLDHQRLLHLALEKD